MKITRFAIKFTDRASGAVSFHEQGLRVDQTLPSFAFAILYATDKHAKAALKTASRKWPAIGTSVDAEVVPVVCSFAD